MVEDQGGRQGPADHALEPGMELNRHRGGDAEIEEPRVGVHLFWAGEAEGGGDRGAEPPAEVLTLRGGWCGITWGRGRGRYGDILRRNGSEGTVRQWNAWRLRLDTEPVRAALERVERQ